MTANELGRSTDESAWINSLAGERLVLVIDLDATCDAGKCIPPKQMKIIEIGAVWATLYGSVVETFQTLVRPVLRLQHTPFCQQLTGIQQPDIDTAQTFPAAAATALASFAERHKAPPLLRPAPLIFALPRKRQHTHHLHCADVCGRMSLILLPCKRKAIEMNHQRLRRCVARCHRPLHLETSRFLTTHEGPHSVWRPTVNFLQSSHSDLRSAMERGALRLCSVSRRSPVPAFWHPGCEVAH
jgi:hypothetical protein